MAPYTSQPTMGSAVEVAEEVSALISSSDDDDSDDAVSSRGCSAEVVESGPSFTVTVTDEGRQVGTGRVRRRYGGRVMSAHRPTRHHVVAIERHVRSLDPTRLSRLGLHSSHRSTNRENRSRSGAQRRTEMECNG
jgi:hypothetical protein